MAIHLTKVQTNMIVYMVPSDGFSAVVKLEH